MTATYQMQRDLGWTFFEQLASRTSCRCSRRPIRRRSSTRRARRDGRRQRIQHLPDEGIWPPVEPVYASEGSPLIIGPNGYLQDAPRSERGKTVSRSASVAGPQLIATSAASAVHAQTTEKAGRQTAKEIKTMRTTGTGGERGEAIKARYTKIFRV